MNGLTMVADSGVSVAVRGIRGLSRRWYETRVCEYCALIWTWSDTEAVRDGLDPLRVLCPCALGLLDLPSVPGDDGLADRARFGVGAGSHVIKQEESGELWVYWEGYVIAAILVPRWLSVEELDSVADKWPAVYADWQ